MSTQSVDSVIYRMNLLDALQDNRGHKTLWEDAASSSYATDDAFDRSRLIVETLLVVKTTVSIYISSTRT